MKGFDYGQKCIPPSSPLRAAVAFVRGRWQEDHSEALLNVPVSAAALHNWVRQRRIDKGGIDGSDFARRALNSPDGRL